MDIFPLLASPPKPNDQSKMKGSESSGGDEKKQYARRGLYRRSMSERQVSDEVEHLVVVDC